jgi:hypothetical protein
MYYMMHHIMMSGSLTLYCVVFSLAQDLDQPTDASEAGHPCGDTGETMLENLVGERAFSVDRRPSETGCLPLIRSGNPGVNPGVI